MIIIFISSQTKLCPILSFHGVVNNDWSLLEYGAVSGGKT